MEEQLKAKLATISDLANIPMKEAKKKLLSRTEKNLRGVATLQNLVDDILSDLPFFKGCCNTTNRKA